MQLFPASPLLRYNVATPDGRLLLLDWVPDKVSAYWWLGYYTERYQIPLQIVTLH